MTSFYRTLSTVLIVCLSNIAIADISTPNQGEQDMIKQLRSLVNQDKTLAVKNISIGAGVTGAQAFITAGMTSITHILLTWQWLNEIKNVAPGTVIVVPHHALDDNFKKIERKVHIIPIDGVLHSKNFESIQKEDTSPIDPNTKIIVMLAGDVQQRDGNWTIYDNNMARGFIDKLPTDREILILNGPRTGKHIMTENGITVDSSAHRTKVDYVTQFIKNSSLGKKWQVADFIYGKPSLLNAALKFCLEHRKTILVLPGESTSMISEALSLGIKPVIYEHRAMTNTSRLYVEKLLEDNRVYLYPQFAGNERYRQRPTKPQGEVVIKALHKILKERGM